MARPYAQLLRGPAHRWWRPLAGLGVVTALGGLPVVAVVVVGVVIALAAGGLTGGGDAIDQATLERWIATPAGLAVNDLLLAALIPTAQVAVWVGHGWRPRWVSSVVGGLRLSWLVHCTLLTLALLVPVTVGLALIGGVPQLDPERDAWLLLAVVLATTPLQAAGEEYFFRGWLTQAIGSLLPRGGAATLAGGAVSSVVFALAHGGQDPWLFADRLAFGVLASFLAWRTGGLEAGIAVHAVNNVVVFVQTILLGGLGDVLASTSAPPEAVLADVLSLAAIGALVEWRARRRRVVRLFTPPPGPQLPGPPRLTPPVHGPAA
jgi:membrane protease YdiL (CAAX protease family)